ncbi:MAG TPA: AAA family ATPase [Acidimicrobiales bacterium]|nr:AAA family ATPase [Acidimicrobiales bacterium]
MGTTVLVGRETEVSALRAAVDRAAGGLGQVVVVEGEPGIGKTRLLTAACDHASAAGFDVFVGGFSDLAPARPFGALLDALGVAPDAADPERAAIASLIDSGDGRASNIATSSNPGLQYRVVEALSGLVERLAERRPLLLAIDDLHWADVSTLVALRTIARRAQTLSVVVIATWRVGHDFFELNRLSDELLRADATRIALNPLDDASVLSLVADMLRGRPSEDVLARVKGASGNPLFVIEYVRSIDAGAVDVGESSAAEFRLAVLRRLASLSEQTKEVLRIAALLGATFSAADLGVATGRPMVQLVPALHEAGASGFVEERGEHLAFRHALVRDAIYEQIPLGLRRELHREIGRTLADAGSDALSVAHHLRLGAREEDPEAAEWLRRAARLVATRSPATAVELLERARDLLGITSPVRDAVLADLAIALAWSGRLAEAEALSSDVLSRQPDPSVAGALRCELVYALTWQGKPLEALRHTVLGRDERISDWDAVLLQAQAAVAHAVTFDFSAAATLGAEAAEQARRLGHDRALCHALTAQAFAAVFSGDDDSIALGRRAVEVADRSGSAEAYLAHPRFFLGSLPMLGRGMNDEAEEMLRSGLQMAERLGLSWSFPLYHAFLGARCFVVSDLDGAIAECETALAVADEVGLHIGMVAAASAWLTFAQLHRDDLEGAECTVAAALSRMSEAGPQLGMGPFTAARALVLEARGNREEALAVVQVLRNAYVTNGGKATDYWTGLTLLRLLVNNGDHEQAAALLLPLGHVEEAHPTTLAIHWHGRGLVAGDGDMLVRAVEHYRLDTNRLNLAVACDDAAQALVGVGRLDEAVPLWEEALAIFDALGAERDIARINAHMRTHGIKRGSRQAHVRAKHGWDSLTATERKVVALVAQRLSNPEVAERLFVSRHTVESHLKNIYRKLGHSSRAQLGQEAAEHVQ